MPRLARLLLRDPSRVLPQQVFPVALALARGLAAPSSGRSVPYADCVLAAPARSPH